MTAFRYFRSDLHVELHILFPASDEKNFGSWKSAFPEITNAENYSRKTTIEDLNLIGEVFEDSKFQNVEHCTLPTPDKKPLQIFRAA